MAKPTLVQSSIVWLLVPDGQPGKGKKKVPKNFGTGILYFDLANYKFSSPLR